MARLKFGSRQIMQKPPSPSKELDLNWRQVKPTGRFWEGEKWEDSQVWESEVAIIGDGPRSEVYRWENNLLGFPGGSEVKASAWNAGDPCSFPALGRSPGEGNGNPLQYFCLENPVEVLAWWAMGSQRVGQDWVTSLHFQRIYCISSADSVTLDLENRIHLNNLVNRCLENMH